MLGYRVEKAQSMMGLACEMDNLALKSTRDSLWNRENTRRCFVDANNEYVVSFIFLPLALTIYYISNNTAKEYVLLGASLGFYALGSVQYIILFAIVIVSTVFIGRYLDKYSNKSIKMVLLIIGIIINSSILIYYKYTDFALETFGNLTSTEVQLKGLILPLGISFFTFKSISLLNSADLCM